MFFSGFKSLTFSNIEVLRVALNLILLFISAGLFFFVRNEQKRRDKINDYLGDITKAIDSVRYGNLTKKINQFDIPDSKNLTESINRMIETLHDREVMVSEYQIELMKQNRILEAIINSLSDGLIITDKDGIILKTTDIIPKWFNCESKKITGKHLSEYIEIVNKRPLSLWKDSDIILLHDKTSNFTASTVELKLEDNNSRYIVILKNISDQRELESLKEDFVATLTHDLKVPIIAETNMLELLLNGTFGEIPEKQKTALNNMQSSNRELLDLVQTVLETYKVGKMTLYKENIMLKPFIEEIISEMKPLAKKSDNTIEFILERDIRVFADKFQLTRVIKNLIQNAISYGSPKTPIEIAIGEIPKFVTIKIKDHGAGISKTDIDRIFNKYYSAAKKFRKIGTGLGLYLAFQIIKAHGGELTVDSREGEYTEFCTKIPV